MVRACLRDSDPYVRKTAATSVAKLFFNNPQVVLNEGLLDTLKDLLKDGNPTVSFESGSKSGSLNCT